MAIVHKLRRVCKNCGELFAPDGKYCRNCYDCRILLQQEFRIKKAMEFVQR